MEYNDKYYVVKEETYKKYFQVSTELTDQLGELRPSVLKKCKTLLEFFENCGLRWNIFGVVTEIVPEMRTEFNIMDFVIYCVTGKPKEPLLFENFIEYLKRVDAPIELLNHKVRKQIKNEKKKRSIAR